MLVASIGCNLAWGMVGGCMLRLNRLAERGHAGVCGRARARRRWGARKASGLLSEAMPPLLSQVMPAEEIQSLHRRLLEQPMPPTSLLIGWRDLRAALAVFPLVFLSTLPVVLPFMVLGEPRHALRIAHAVALAMLFAIGFCYGRSAAARRPWLTARVFTVLGVALIFASIALGG